MNYESLSPAENDEQTVRLKFVLYHTSIRIIQ